jgi:hypothetical protein
MPWTPDDAERHTYKATDVGTEGALNGRTDPNRESCIKIGRAFKARIGLLLFVPLQRPENNEQAIRGNADEDAHEAFETGRNIGYRAWPLSNVTKRPRTNWVPT